MQYEGGASSTETSRWEIEAMRHPAQFMGISLREVGVFKTSGARKGEVGGFCTDFQLLIPYPMALLAATAQCNLTHEPTGMGHPSQRGVEKGPPISRFENSKKADS